MRWKGLFGGAGYGALAGLLLTLLALPGTAQVPAWRWALNAAGPGAEQAAAVAVDGAGYTVVAGTFSGQLTLGGTRLISRGGGDAFFARFDPAGVCQWAAQAGSPGEEEATHVALDRAGNVLVSGFFLGDSLRCGATALRSGGGRELFVGALDGPTGRWQWATRLGGSGDEKSCGLAVDRAGRVVLAGTFESDTLRLGAARLPNGGVARQAPTAFVAALNATTGAWLWAVNAGPDAQPAALAVDGSGGVVLAGTFESAQLKFGDRIVLRNAQPRRADGFVAKLDGVDRTWLWAASLGGVGDETLDAVVVDSSGDVVVAGQLGNAVVRFGALTLVNTGDDRTSDVFVARLDGGDGRWRWNARLGGTGDETVTQLAVGPAHALLLLATAGTNNMKIGVSTLRNPDAETTGINVLACLDALTGTWRWAFDGGATDALVLRALAPAPGGSIAVVGDLLADKCPLGPGPPLVRTASEQPTSGPDVFVGRLGP